MPKGKSLRLVDRVAGVSAQNAKHMCKHLERGLQGAMARKVAPVDQQDTVASVR